MNYFFTLLLTILAVEYFIYLPFIKHGKSLLTVAKKSINCIISKRISDHWKEVVLLRYAQALIKATVYLFIMLISLLLLVVAVAILFDRLITSQPSTLEILSIPLNWFWITLIAIVYLYFRKNIIRNDV